MGARFALGALSSGHASPLLAGLLAVEELSHQQREQGRTAPKPGPDCTGERAPEGPHFLGQKA